MPTANRDTRLMVLTIGTVVGLQSGDDAWGQIAPGEMATVTRGLANTIVSPNPNPDDILTVQCYEEDGLFRQLNALMNAIKADPTGLIPTGGAMRTPTQTATWQSAALTRPGGFEAGRVPKLSVWTFSLTGLVWTAL